MMDAVLSRPWQERVTTDLDGKTVLVIGGAGGVGEGVVRALLAAGATAIAAGRSLERLEDLAARVADSRLVTVALDALDAGLDDRASELAEQYGPFDAVVVSVASWGEQGRKMALDLTDAEWENLIAGNLTSVFRLYRAFLPHVAESGILLQLNGMSADIPFPGNAGVALTAAATKSLTRTIAAELGGRGPRIYEVILGMIRTRPRALAGIDDESWIPATDVGKHITELVAGTSPLVDDDLHYFLSPVTGPQAGSSE